MGWIQDLVKPQTRQWEDFYRNRWQHDTSVRSTHGVNCTGGCSWMVYVKEGIVTWEMQATDYPLLEEKLPPYEPRGCQRGISTSWYVYSPLRVKYPYIRGVLADCWEEARRTLEPVEAWKAIQADPGKRERIQQARGKGGFRRTTWAVVEEIIAAAMLHTAQEWGPDRVFGFSPIPAMSYLSYAGGSRFLQLFGGVNMSFYDWYADLPNAFPEVWGDQTDVCESADWFNSKYIVSVGANLSMTRTPDVHFISEARQEGAKFVVISPDLSMVAKYSDWWLPVEAGQDTALWLAVNHVILTEFHAQRQVPYFMDYLKRTTDCPMLVELMETPDGGLAPGQFLRAGLVDRYQDVEHGDWKLLMWDDAADAPRMPKGTVGFRWAKEEAEKGKWNLKLEDGLDDSRIDPVLSFLDRPGSEVAQVSFLEFASKAVQQRGVPARRIRTADGRERLVATVYDLLFAQMGVGRGLPGDYPRDYDDASGAYTPAWQEQFTKIGKETVLQLAREFAGNAEATNGKSMIIVGASLNHWYNNNLSYRAPITALVLCGCCGVNGGGMNHYVGQEKLTLVAPWTALAFATDWQRPPRQQQSPTWHYVHSDQWRYEGDFTDYAPVPDNAKWAKGHAMDLEALAVRAGWMPFYPQFDANPLDLAGEARGDGATSKEEIVDWVGKRIADGTVKLAVDDPDAEASWPRVWLIWRGNAISSSAKGHEFFLRHYLGTHDNVVAEEHAKGSVKTVTFREPAPRGKMDLVVDVNFRMDTSALYSDIVLPAATWYEKNDLNTTDLHSYVHPLQAAVPPVWESRSDWETFKSLAKKVSELSPSVFPGGVAEDIVMGPLQHDTPDELAQPQVLDWRAGECEAVPGVTMPHLRIVERDYANLHNRFISLGPGIRSGLSAHGMSFSVEKFYEELLANPVSGTPDVRHMRCVEWGGERYPSVEDALDAANVLLYLAPETNGEVAYQAFLAEEHKTGLVLADLAEPNRNTRTRFGDLAAQPMRTLTSPCWTGDVNNGRAYSAWVLNNERLIPWRTLAGRQMLYVDHPYYIDFGEQLPTYKPKLDPRRTRDIVNSPTGEGTITLNYITPHGKWHIHSTFGDNHRMQTLSRGIEPCWINDKDAESVGIVDNDWVEVYNDNGVMVTRAAVSHRVQQGTCMIYHAPERTLTIPKSQVRGSKRGGAHNSLTRTRINPVQLAGGYAQFTYGFNYWGPIGVFTRDTYAVVKKLERLEW